MYVIRSTVEKDDETGERLYWSDQHGWVDISEASEYTQAEVDGIYRLPANSEWERRFF